MRQVSIGRGGSVLRVAFAFIVAALDRAAGLYNFIYSDGANLENPLVASAKCGLTHKVLAALEPPVGTWVQGQGMREDDGSSHFDRDRRHCLRRGGQSD